MSPRRTAAVAALLLVGVAGTWLLTRRSEAPSRVESPDAVSPEAVGPHLVAAPKGAPKAKESTPAPAKGPWRLVGTVKSAVGGPVVGARVHVSLQRGQVIEELPGATTRGQDGAYDVDLAAVEKRRELERAGGQLLVRATAARHRPGDWRNVSLPAPGAVDPVVADLVLEPGAAIRGRVIRAGGAPVPEASVLLTRDGVFKGWTRTDREGRYEIGIGEAGESRITATASSVGAGALTLPLDVDADTDVPDLLLHGAAGIDGAVRYVDGSAVADTQVHARPDDGSGEGGADDEADAHDANEGLVRTLASTDASGRFHLRGLKPGRYVLWTEAAKGSAFDTGETNALVVVALRRLRVRVRDAQGRPLPGAGYLARWGTGPSDDMVAGGVNNADASVDFWGKPGTTIRVAAHANDLPPAEVAATLEEGRNETEATLTLKPDDRPKGWIRLSVADPMGNPIPRNTVDVRTEIAASVVLYEKEPDERGRLPPVPPGRYVVEVNPGRAPNAAPVETYFQIDAPVEVKSGEETAVALTARRGGRVRLTVRGSGKKELPEDIAVVAQSKAGGDPVRMGAAVTVKDTGYTMSGLRPGEPGILWTLLEPGTYDLRVTAPGWKEGRATVSIDPGQIADAEVVLRPE